jgi:hypothetical protein
LDRKDRKDRKDPQVQLDRKALKALMDLKVRRELKVIQGHKVQAEQAHKAQQAHKVLLDQQVLPAESLASSQVQVPISAHQLVLLPYGQHLQAVVVQVTVTLILIKHSTQQAL